MQSRTNSSATSKSEVVPRVNIRNRGVFRGGERVVYETVGIELFGFRVVVRIVVQRPHVDHYDGVFGDEIAFVPVVLDDEVVLAKFIHWAPSEDFLTIN